MILLLAWRNIWRNKIRSIVILFSVALGLFAGMAVLALYKGMMVGRINILVYQEAGHVQLHHPFFPKDHDPVFTIPDTKFWLDVLQHDQRVKHIAKRSVTSAMLSTTTGSAGVNVYGIQPEEETLVSQLQHKIIEGVMFHANKVNEVLIGRKLANKMKLDIGNKLVLTFTDTTSNLIAAAYRVAGIYQSENSVFDEHNIYMKMNELNSMLGIGASLHEISILLHHDDSTDNVKASYQSLSQNTLVETWKDISPETDLMNRTIDIYSIILLAIIFLALAFGIINTMLMAILERTREIGMMTALGMDKRRLFGMILFETIFLTLIGTPIGLGISWIIIARFAKTGIDWSRTGQEMLHSFGFSTRIYPIFPYDQLFTVIYIVVITAFVSCIFPAMKALQLQPGDALRK